MLNVVSKGRVEVANNYVVNKIKEINISKRRRYDNRLRTKNKTCKSAKNKIR